MYTVEIYNKMKCSMEDKMELRETLDKILALSKISRSYGLLAMEKELESIENPMFKKAIQMVISGTERDIIRELLLNYCLTGEYSGKEFLRRILVLEGALMIQMGTHPYMVMEKLASFMGEEMITEIEKRYDNSVELEELLFLKRMEGIKERPTRTKETSLLEAPFMKLDDRSIQRVLRDVDEYTLCRALFGASGNTQERVFLNVSRKTAIMLSEEMDALEGTLVTDILECQKRIIEILNSLVAAGEIVI